MDGSPDGPGIADDFTGPRQFPRLAVSLGIGVVVLLLTAGVTTTSFSGQKLAENSSSVHAFDEVLRSLTLTQAELAISLTLNDLEQNAGVDTDDGAVDARQRARLALAVAETAAEALRTNRPDGTTAAEALEAYVQTATSIVGNDQAGSSQLADLDQAFDRAVELLALEREQAAEQVRESDRTLAIVSRLVSFLTAFVVPSAGVVIYRLLAVPRHDLLRAEAALVRERRMADLRVKLITERLSTAEQHFAQSSGPEAQGAERNLSYTRKALLAISNRQQSLFEAVEMHALLEAAKDAAEPDGFAVELSGTTDLLVETDHRSAECLFALLFANLARAAADPVRCVTSTVDNSVVVELSIPPDLPGMPMLTELDEPLALEGRLDRLERREDPELYVVLLLAESLGLHLRLDSTSADEHVLQLRLPSAEHPPSPVGDRGTNDHLTVPTPA